MRVVCEHCQTVYNIPETKLTRDVSQATCKVCQNKILIKRDVTSTATATAEAGPVPEPRSPVATPTMVSTSLQGMPETELSNSWREAIVDNRETHQMLKKIGVPVPPDASTASGPKVGAAPPVPPAVPGSEESHEPTAMMDGLPPPGEPLELASGNGASRPVGSLDPPMAPTSGAKRSAPVMRTTPRPRLDEREPSAILGIAAGAAAGAAMIAMLHERSWSSGLGGLLGLGAVTFAASASLLNGALRRRGRLALALVLSVSGVAALLVCCAVLATGGERTRELAARHPFLQPFTKVPLPNLPFLPHDPPSPASTPGKGSP
jgi:hypothetical protein